MARKDRPLYLILLEISVLLLCSPDPSGAEDVPRDDVESLFSGIDEDVLGFNVLAADFTWRVSVGETVDPREGLVLERTRNEWHRNVCSKMTTLEGSILMDDFRKREIYLLCRGVTFDDEESESVNDALDNIQSTYTNTKICIPKTKGMAYKNVELHVLNYLKKVQHNIDRNNSKHVKFSGRHLKNAVTNSAVYKASQLNDRDTNEDSLCLSGEPDLERLMSESRIEPVLKWSWLVWRQAVGPPMRPFYTMLVRVENEASKRQGFSDIGEVWRDELEMDDLKDLVDRLFLETRELYGLLHGVTRYFLNKRYGTGGEYIQAHLTGNMWAQNWAAILNLILPVDDVTDVNEIIKKTNWTARDMVIRAEDFYTSMSLPRMTENFWKYSYFGSENETSKGIDPKCHGTAANMFTADDYRMIYCAKLSMEDFYVIHHELGHIEYYMSYEEGLPVVFQDGVNSAFQESIGDAIMLGAMVPQHLHRLSLIGDDLLYVRPRNKKFHLIGVDKKTMDFSFDDVLLLYQGLNKIPHVPFGYALEKYRWDVFSGEVDEGHYNDAFWKYTKKYQGIEPPDGLLRDERYFDAGAKFHVPDNTPYVRYFLSSFLQMQMFKGMCQMNLFGKIDPNQTLPMPLHRCDIYGAKKAGKKLKDVMSKGRSIGWSDALFELTGERTITSTAFLEYFSPLETFLNKIKDTFNIDIGFDD